MQTEEDPKDAEDYAWLLSLVSGKGNSAFLQQDPHAPVRAGEGGWEGPGARERRVGTCSAGVHVPKHHLEREVFLASCPSPVSFPLKSGLNSVTFSINT